MIIWPCDEPENELFFGLAAPARRALDAAGIQRLEELTKFSAAEVKQWHGIGPHVLRQVLSALAAKGLSFAKEK